MQPERKGDDLSDYFAAAEKRKFERFRTTAFLGTPLHLKALPPFFGAPIEGQVIDLSAGGMAILIREALPAQAKMHLELLFPNKHTLSCIVIIRRVSGCTGGFLTGLQFMDLPADMVAVIDRMAHDYNACDARIAGDPGPSCLADCSFMSLCDKPQKMKTPVQNRVIEMDLKPFTPLE